MTSTDRSQAEISAAREIRAALIPLSSIAEATNLSMLGQLLKLAIDEAEQIIGEKQNPLVRTVNLGKR